MLLQIVNQDTSEPVANAQVNITSASGAVKHLSAVHFTNLDGKVEESSITDGSFTVSVSADGFIEVVKDIKIECENIACNDCSQNYSVALQPMSMPVTTLSPTCPDTGHIFVQDEVTGDAISGAAVNVVVVVPNEETGQDEEITVVEDRITAEDGLVSVPLTINGVYQVTAVKDGYGESVLAGTVDCQIEDCSLCSLNLTASMRKDNNTVCEDVDMRIHIRDDLDQPVEGALVNVFISGQNAPLNTGSLLTDLAGEVIVTVPETGEFTVTVEAPGRLFLTANRNVSCNPSECETCHPVIKFTLEEEPVITEPPICNDGDSVTLTINIIDALTEAPVDKARTFVTLVPENDENHDKEGHGDHIIASNVAANAEGQLNLHITENGEYTALVSALGYLNSTKSVTIQCNPDDCNNCSETIHVLLQQDFCPSTVFTIGVKDEATGLPLEGASVGVSVKVGNRSRPVSQNLVCKPRVSDLPRAISQTQNQQQNDCGYHGIGEQDCLARQCCWDDSNEDTSFCFFMEEEGDMLTDENGIVSMPIMGEGDYQVYVEKNGYKSANLVNDISCPVEGSCEECRPGLTLTLQQDFCNNTMQMKIHVVDTHQNPVENANVNLILSSSAAGASSSNIGGELFTDANGEVSPFIYESGTYMISVSHVGFEARSVETIVTNTSCIDLEVPVLVTLEELDTIDTTLPSTCPEMVLNVTIVDNVTSLVIPGASISVTTGAKDVAQNVLTDQHGQVNLPISINGEYSIVANKEGYKVVNGAKTINCSVEDQCMCDTSITMNMDQPSCRGESNPMVLPVIVRDNVTNTPIANSLVTLVLINSLSGTSQINIEHPKYTDEEGFTNFTVPLNGGYSLQVDAPGYVMKEIPVTVNCDPHHCEACILSAPVKLNEQFCENKALEMTIRDTLNNSLISNVKVVVSQETYSGPRLVMNGLVGLNGTIKVPLKANGMYTSKVSKPGFVTMERRFEVNIPMDKCELIKDLVELTPLHPTPPSQCVRLSLSWGPEPQDLDLYSYRVNTGNITDNCLSNYCNKETEKDPCEGATFRTDNKHGGLNGSETITYCKTEEFSNMVYVDDMSGKGSSLLTSQARLSIAGAGRTQEIILDPSKASRNESRRYWLAGCLSTTNSGRFHFTTVNKFTEEEPKLEEPLNCHNRMLLEEAKNSYTLTLSDSTAEVIVRNADTEEPLSDVMVTLANAKSSYSLLTKQDGRVSVPIKENGNYTLLAQKDDFVAEKITVNIACDTSENCSVPVSVSLLSEDQAQGIEVLLEWENTDQDLDLHVVQVNSLDTRISCETSYSNMEGCKDTSLNHNTKAGGESEIISIKNVAANSRFTHMVFVEDNSIMEPLLKHSEGVTVTVTDGAVASIEDLSLEEVEDGSKYWFVGCIKLVGESFEFVSVGKFSRVSPSSSSKLHCDSLFKHRSGAGAEEPFCPNVDVTVKVRNGLTNQIVANATVSVIKISEDDEEIITEGLAVDHDGQAATLVHRNGNYTIKVEADGFITTERELEVSCDISACDQCRPGAFIPLSPNLEADTMRLSLSWGRKPMDLDLQVFRRTWTDWDDSCRHS